MFLSLLAVGAYLVIVGWLFTILSVAISDYIPDKIYEAANKGGQGLVVFGILELIIVTGIGLAVWIF